MTLGSRRPVERRPGLRHRVIDLVRRDLHALRPRRDGPPPEQNLTALRRQLGRPVRVAVARLDGLGDWVLTLPLIQALLASDDVGDVTIVAPAALRSLLERNTGAAFLGLRLGTRINRPWPGGALGELRSFSFLAQNAAFRDGRLHRAEFDLVVVPRWDVDRGFNLHAWGLGADALLAGHDPRDQALATPAERREADLLTIAVRVEPAPAHELERLKSLMAALGLPTTVETAYGATFFGVPAGGVRTGSSRSVLINTVLIHTGAGEPKRQWPEANFRQLIQRLLQDPAVRVVLVGGSADVASQQRMAAGLESRVDVRSGTTPLGDLPELVSAAAVLIGNDSGPAHLAAAIGVPTLVISAHPVDGLVGHGNSPTRFGPVGSPTMVLQPPRALPPCAGWCSADHPHCITQLSVDEVFAGYLHLVEQS